MNRYVHVVRNMTIILPQKQSKWVRMGQWLVFQQGQVNIFSWKTLKMRFGQV